MISRLSAIGLSRAGDVKTGTCPLGLISDKNCSVNCSSWKMSTSFSSTRVAEASSLAGPRRARV